MDWFIPYLISEFHFNPIIILTWGAIGIDIYATYRAFMALIKVLAGIRSDIASVKNDVATVKSSISTNQVEISDIKKQNGKLLDHLLER
jgi:hypothetical protein